LVLELLATVELTAPGARAIASVYRMTTEHGQTVFAVRGVANMGVDTPEGDALCLRSDDLVFEAEASARKAAPPVAERLIAWATHMRTVLAAQPTETRSKGRAS
jgi:hypothetical protein